VIDIFDRCLRGKIDSAAAEEALQKFIMTGECDGYWHGQAGMDSVNMNKTTRDK